MNHRITTLVAAVLAAGSVAAGAPAAAIGKPQVTNLRFGGHAGFDRAVVDLNAPGAEIRALWTKQEHLSDCTGEKYHVPGKKFLILIVDGARAHTDDGKRDTYVGPGETESARVGLKNIKGVRFDCDFEGQVTFALGLDHKAQVSVGKLGNPNRLYVDITH